MAIGKWISFGAPQTPSHSPPAAVVPARPAVVSPADAKLFGLENLYANSVLQALYYCGPFRELLLQYPDPSVPDVSTLTPPTVLSPQPAAPPERKFSMSEAPSQTQPSTSSTHNVTPSTSTIFTIPQAPPTLLSALRSLYMHISKNPADKGTVPPRAFIDKLRELNELFRGSMHQDAHEFLNFLLNRIVEEMEEDRKNGYHLNGSAIGAHSGEDLSTSIATISSLAAPPTTTTSGSTTHPSTFHTTFVHRLFEGTLTSETRCLTCETVSSRDESFLDLSIDIEQNSSVTACLRQFSASEMLCQKNKFFCDSCCDLQEAEKRMKIKKLPHILALHLKRFKYQEDVGKYIKLAYRVAFPVELRLFNTVDDAEDPDRLYELFAIVVHIGNGPHHGHYVTLIKARGTWMLFDDDNVDIIKESDIPKYFGDSSSGAAYVLYYQAADLDMAALGIRPPAPAAAPIDITLKAGNSASLATDSGDTEPGSPALPPGLSEELDLSDQSDSPPPATPATHPVPLSTNPNAKVAPPNLVLSIPPTSPSQSSPAVTSATPGGTLGGLFNTLRHTPSMRVRANGNGTDSRRSVLDTTAPPVPVPPVASSSHRPQTAHSVASTAETSHHAHDFPTVPGSPIRQNGTVKEKEKTPEKKGSMWFKRKSSRLEASFSGAPTDRAAPPARDDAWFHTAQPGKDGFARRGSKIGLFDSRASAAPPDHTTTSTPSSPIVHERPLPEHKKSTPDFARKTSKLSAPVAGKLPPRPSTAGATVGRSRPLSIVPPLPTLPASPSTPRTPATNGFPSLSLTASGKGKAGPNQSPDGGRAMSADSAPPRSPRLKRPSSATSPGAGALGFSTSDSTASTTSVSVAEGPPPSLSASVKRSTRKLSFNAPMLGFGRNKDKDRTKERDRERDARPPPSAFYPSLG
ncbi:cysteine proteinase [Amylocystis lapponica]|nr:cysteine proteinase [Amylocystis lapponica]